MRWKLLIIASFIAGLTGVAICLTLAFTLSFAPPLLLAFIFGVATFTASLFVYRRTARRRALQAILTALGTALVGALALYATDYYLRRAGMLPPPPLKSDLRVQVANISGLR